MPKIVDYEEKKHQIMQEAVKIFIERGYSDTQLSHIAERCKMGRTTLYQYFKNKDEIFFYATDYIFQVFRNNYQSISEDPKLSNLEKIKQIVLAGIKECSREQNKMIVLMELWLNIKRGNKTVGRKVEGHLNDLRKYFRLLLERGIAAKEIRPVNVDSMAFLLYSLVESFIFQASFVENASIEDNIANINVLLNGLHV